MNKEKKIFSDEDYKCKKCDRGGIIGYYKGHLICCACYACYDKHFSFYDDVENANCQS